MKKLTTLLLVALASLLSTANALEPIRVSILTSYNTAQAVTVTWSNGPTVVFNAAVTPQAGVMSFVIGEGVAAWTAATPASITSADIITINIAGTDVSAPRLDRIISTQGLFGRYVDPNEIQLTTNNLLLGGAGNLGTSLAPGADNTVLRVNGVVPNWEAWPAVTQGAGLTGTDYDGSLGTVAFAVGEGNGINVTANAVEVEEGLGLNFSGTTLQVNQGEGLEFNGDILRVNQGDGLEFVGDALAVDLFGTNPGLTFNGGELIVDPGTGMILDANGVSINTTGVTAGTYGAIAGFGVNQFTVNAQGQLTAASQTTFNDAAGSDIDVFGGSWNSADLQLKDNTVDDSELNTTGAAGINKDILIHGVPADEIRWSSVGALMEDLTEGNGIADFVYDGSAPATVAVELATTNPGLDFAVGATNANALRIAAAAAGNGLAGGGGAALSVNAGNGLVINADNVDINLASPSGLEIVADALRVDVFNSTLTIDAGGLYVPTGGITSNEIFNGTIADIDVSPTAEIAVSKLGDGNAFQLIETATDGLTVQWVTVAGDVARDGTGLYQIQANTVGNTEILNTDNFTFNSATTTDDVSVGDDLIFNSIAGQISNSAGTSVLVNDDLVLLGGGDLVFDAAGSVIANTAGAVTVQDNMVITNGLDISGGTFELPIGGTVNEITTTVSGASTNSQLPTALAAWNAIAAVGAEPILTFAADGGTLTNNRVATAGDGIDFVNSGADNGTLTVSVDVNDIAGTNLENDGSNNLRIAASAAGDGLVGGAAADLDVNVNSTLAIAADAVGINLTNPNTWTGTQTFSAVGNGVVITTAANLQGNVVNTTGNDITFTENLLPSLDNSFNIGSDATRWANAYFNGGSVHIGPTGGEGGNTELAFTYAGGTAGINVDGGVTPELQLTTAALDVNNNLDANNGLDVTGANLTVGGANFTVTNAGAVTSAGLITSNGGLDVNTGTFQLATGGTVNEITTTVSGASTNSQLPTALAAWNAIAAVGAEPILTFAADGGTLTNNRVATAGDGIDFVNSGADNGTLTVSVDVNDIAGTNLENDGSNNLRIAASAAGDGLVGGGAADLDVNVGAGLEINTDAVRISAAAAGAGLAGGAGSALSVNAGNGLVLNVDDVDVNVNSTLAIAADAVGINLTNPNSWTGAQTFSDIVINDATVTGTNNLVLDGDAAGGDLSGTYPNPTVDGIEGIDVVLTALATGEVLQYDGTNWINVDNTVNTNATLVGDGSVGTPLGLNLNNANTWVGNQLLPANATQGNNLIASINTGTAEGINGGMVNRNTTLTVVANELGLNLANANTWSAVQSLPGNATQGNNLITAINLGTAQSINGGMVDRDASLTLTGAELGLNLANANSWSQTQTFPTSNAQGNALINSINAGNSNTLVGSVIDYDATLTVTGTDLGVNVNNANTWGATQSLPTSNPQGNNIAAVLNAANNQSVNGDVINIDATLAVSANNLGINLTNANSWGATQSFPLTGAQGNALVASINAATTDIDGDNVTFDATLDLNGTQLSINTGNANTWTALQTFSANVDINGTGAGDALDIDGNGQLAIDATSSAATADFDRTTNGNVVTVTGSGNAGGAAAPLRVNNTSGAGQFAISTSGGVQVGGTVDITVADQAGLGAQNNSATNPLVALDNQDVTSGAFAIVIENGNTKLSADLATAVIVTGGTITTASTTVIRLTSGGVLAGGVTLSGVALPGTIIVITNEDAGDITITAGVLTTYTIAGQTAKQFVYNGATWVALQ